MNIKMRELILQKIFGGNPILSLINYYLFSIAFVIIKWSKLIVVCYVKWITITQVMIICSTNLMCPFRTKAQRFHFKIGSML